MVKLLSKFAIWLLKVTEEKKPVTEVKSKLIDLNPIGFGKPIVFMNDIVVETTCLSCGRAWEEKSKGKIYLPNYVIAYENCSHCSLSKDENG